MQHELLTREIIGCAMHVHNCMGFGYLESVFEKCMVIALNKANLNVDRQVPIPVRYEGQVVGDFYADLLVEDTIIVELKSIRALNKAHGAQLVNYLTATGKDVGLLINFGPKSVEAKRKVRELKV